MSQLANAPMNQSSAARNSASLFGRWRTAVRISAACALNSSGQ